MARQQYGDWTLQINKCGSNLSCVWNSANRNNRARLTRTTETFETDDGNETFQTSKDGVNKGIRLDDNVEDYLPQEAQVSGALYTSQPLKQSLDSSATLPDIFEDRSARISTL
jgi:hypothetical protein